MKWPAHYGIGLVVAVLFLSLAWSDDNTARGEQIYKTCQVCHGKHAEGNPSIGTPRLSGLQEWYLVRQLEKFRNGMRGNHDADYYGGMMSAMAKTLPDQQAVEDVTSFIGSLETAEPVRPELEGDPQRGKEIYAGCIQCHGSRGQGLKASGSGLATYNLDCPKLSGQNPRYLSRQLKSFRSGQRGYHPDDKAGKDMQGRVRTLYNDQMIKDVIAYITTL